MLRKNADIVLFVIGLVLGHVWGYSDAANKAVVKSPEIACERAFYNDPDGCGKFTMRGQ